jgi:hypothetical protein
MERGSRIWFDDLLGMCYEIMRPLNLHFFCYENGILAHRAVVQAAHDEVLDFKVGAMGELITAARQNELCEDGALVDLLERPFGNGSVGCEGQKTKSKGSGHAQSFSKLSNLQGSASNSSSRCS